MVFFFSEKCGRFLILLPIFVVVVNLLLIRFERVRSNEFSLESSWYRVFYRVFFTAETESRDEWRRRGWGKKYAKYLTPATTTTTR